MIKNVIDYLEITEKKFGGKKAYCDENREITFSELKDSALKIASGLLDAVSIGTPVLVYMNKSVEVIEAFLGVAYTGGFYVPIDMQMPYERVKLIIDTLGAKHLLACRVPGKGHCRGPHPLPGAGGQGAGSRCIRTGGGRCHHPPGRDHGPLYRCHQRRKKVKWSVPDETVFWH